jgi:hypothetical protein
MKLPKWLIVILLSTSTLAALGAGVWWWVTWPERTARKFVELMALDDDHRVLEMLSSELAPKLGGPATKFGTPIQFLKIVYREMPEDELQEPGALWTYDKLQPCPRTVLDYLKAREHFIVQSASFTVQRGVVANIGFVLDGEDRSLLEP